MDQLTQIILQAGRSAVELSLFVLLPIMVVMLSLMRLLEARGVLDWVVARLAPLLRPAGLTGLGVFAALQINLVSFAAPMATLTMMESRGDARTKLPEAFWRRVCIPHRTQAVPCSARASTSRQRLFQGHGIR